MFFSEHTTYMNGCRFMQAVLMLNTVGEIRAQRVKQDGQKLHQVMAERILKTNWFLAVSQAPADLLSFIISEMIFQVNRKGLFFLNAKQKSKAQLKDQLCLSVALNVICFLKSVKNCHLGKNSIAKVFTAVQLKVNIQYILIISYFARRQIIFLDLNL